MRYTKGCNKLLLCECVLGETWGVAQSMPFLTPAIVHAKVRTDSASNTLFTALWARCWHGNVGKYVVATTNVCCLCRATIR